MKKLLNLFILSLVALNFIACDDNSPKNKELTPINKESPLVIHTDEEIKSKQKEQKILNKIGITASSDKITIDINKTKSFLDSMAKILDKKAKKIEDKTKNLDSSDLGIKIDNDKVEIDLKKSKSFLEDFAKELDGIVKEIDKEVEK